MLNAATADDQQQDQRHHGLLDADRAKITRILLGPVADAVAAAVPGGDRGDRGAHRRHELPHLERVGEAQAQSARTLRQRRERSHVIELRQDQRVVVILEPGLEHSADRELAQARLRSAVRRRHRHQQRHRIADAHAQLIGDVAAEDHRIAAGPQRIERPFHHQGPHVGDRRLEPRVDAAKHHRQHLGQPHRQRGQLHVRRHPDHTGDALQALAQRLFGIARGHAGRGDVSLGTQRQQSIAQLALKAVHHRQDHDQRRDPERHARERHPGDQRDEELVLPRAHVAQTDED